MVSRIWRKNYSLYSEFRHHENTYYKSSILLIQAVNVYFKKLQVKFFIWWLFCLQIDYHHFFHNTFYYIFQFFFIAHLCTASLVSGMNETRHEMKTYLKIYTQISNEYKLNWTLIHRISKLIYMYFWQYICLSTGVGYVSS